MTVLVKAKNPTVEREKVERYLDRYYRFLLEHRRIHYDLGRNYGFVPEGPK